MATYRVRRANGVLDYKAGYCAQVVEFMGRGYSLTAFAGEIGTTLANVMEWRRLHSPFADAVERGQARRARLLEERLFAATNAGVRGVHLKALKTAAPEDWAGRKPVAPTPRSPPPVEDRPEPLIELPDNGR